MYCSSFIITQPNSWTSLLNCVVEYLHQKDCNDSRRYHIATFSRQLEMGIKCLLDNDNCILKTPSNRFEMFLTLWVNAKMLQEWSDGTLADIFSGFWGPFVLFSLLWITFAIAYLISHWCGLSTPIISPAEFECLGCLSRWEFEWILWAFSDVSSIRLHRMGPAHSMQVL